MHQVDEGPSQPTRTSTKARVLWPKETYKDISPGVKPSLQNWLGKEGVQELIWKKEASKEKSVGKKERDISKSFLTIKYPSINSTLTSEHNTCQM